MFELLEQRTLFSNSLHLAFSEQPPNGVAYVQLASFIQLQVEDAQGNVATNDSSQVTLAVESGPPGGALAGTNGVTAFNGIATFGNLWLTAAGQYTLIASDPTADSAISAAFTISTQTATVSVASSNVFAITGEPFSVSANVAPSIQNMPTPTGMVTFTDATQTLGAATLVNGVATLAVTEAMATDYGPITANYAGDAVYTSNSGTSTSRQIVTPLPDFAVKMSGALPTSQVVEGQPARLRQKIVITNASSTPFADILSGQLYLTTGTTVDSGAILLETVFSGTVRLGVHHSRAAAFSIASLPTTVPAGTYHLTLHLTGNTAVTAASASTIVVVAPVKQLGGAVLSVGPRARLNGFDSATISISNTGNVPAIGSLAVDYYVSSIATGLTRSAIYVGITPPLKIHLLPGQKTIRHVRVPMRVSGTYYLWAEIDPNNAFDVANNGHPTAVSSTTVVVT